MNQPVSKQLLDTFTPITPVDDTAIVIHQAPDLYALWEALEMEAQCVCPPPFWGVVWPGARLLVRYILKNRSLFEGKSVLDFGCGCGAAAIAALVAGAQSAEANDIDATALFVAEQNGRANHVNLIIDSSNLLATAALQRQFDIVLISDMFYEESTASPLLSLLQYHRRQGAEVLIADGNRPFTPRKQLTLLETATFMVNKAVEGKTERTTTLYRLTGTGI